MYIHRFLRKPISIMFKIKFTSSYLVITRKDLVITKKDLVITKKDLVIGCTHADELYH